MNVEKSCTTCRFKNRCIERSRNYPCIDWKEVNHAKNSNGKVYLVAES